MKKIAKYIASALNNSSANEAATALKMAAARMQTLNVNPSSLLQEKGAQADTSDLEARVEDAEKAADYWEAKYRQSQKSTGSQDATTLRAQLTEARALAVKLAREGDQKDLEIADLARASLSYYQDKATLQAWVRRFKKWAISGLVIAGLGAICAFTVIDDQDGELTKLKDSVYVKEKRISNLEARLSEATGKPINPFDEYDSPTEDKAPKAAPSSDLTYSKRSTAPSKAHSNEWHPRGGVYTIDARCTSATGFSNYPSFMINMNDKSVSENSQLFSGNFDVILPYGEGIAAKIGDKFQVKANTGAIWKCTVTSAYE